MRLEIIVLGLLSEGAYYGYEIKKKIIERMGDVDFVDINFGSIYYTIKKAVTNKWITESKTEKSAGNPDRYVYKILPEGRKHYLKLVKQYFDQKLIHFEIDILLMFYDTLDERQKRDFIDDRKEYISDKLEELGKTGGKKKVANSAAVRSYLENHLKAELAWVKSLE